MKTAMTKIGNPFSSTKKTTCSHSKGKRSILIPAWALSVRTVLWPPKKPLPSIPFAPFGCRTAGKDGAKLPERGKKWLERKRGQRKKRRVGSRKKCPIWPRKRHLWRVGRTEDQTGKESRRGITGKNNVKFDSSIRRKRVLKGDENLQNSFGKSCSKINKGGL